MTNYLSTTAQEKLTRKGFRKELIATLSDEQKEMLLMDMTLETPISDLVASSNTYANPTEKRKAARNRKSGRNLNKLLNKYPSVQLLDFWDSMAQTEKLALLSYLDSIVKGSAVNEKGEQLPEDVVMTPFREEEYTGCTTCELEPDL